MRVVVLAVLFGGLLAGCSGNDDGAGTGGSAGTGAATVVGAGAVGAGAAGAGITLVAAL